jgi:hypothetical protein
MHAGRLRLMARVLALQLLAGPIVAHQLTRPLAEALNDFQTPQSEVLDEITHAWLRAMATDGDAEADPDRAFSG